MTTHFTSDTHFGHKNIIKFCPVTRSRFFDAEQMDEYLIVEWNKVVDVNDVVYHLGDFAFASQGRIREVIYQLNGRIRMLTGNHDKALSGTFGEQLVIEGAIDAIYPGYHEVKINGTLLVLNHFAQRVWNKSHFGSLHLYGHSHGSLPGQGKSVDVGVDSAELGLRYGTLRPYSFEEVLKYLDTKIVYKPDHHDENTGK